MKVLQISRQYLPSIGGIESVVDGLSRALLHAGHQVKVLTLNKVFATGETMPEQSTIDGIEVSRMRYWGSRRYPLAPQVLNHINGYDLIHVHAVDFFVDFLAWSQFLHDRPIVLSTHGGIFHTKWLSALKSAYFRTVTRSSLKRVAAVLCVSDHDFELFSEVVPRQKLHLMRNGVNVRPYLTIDKRVKPGLLVGIGRAAENKGIDRLLQAVALLRNSHPEARLLWIGPDEADRVASLKALARQLDIADRVEFTGPSDAEQLRSHLAQANAFVCSSSYEGYGLSTIEAMSSGTVPVVTRVGIHPNVIDHGRSGFLMEEDSVAIADALRQVLSLDAGELAAMGATARDAARKCSWQEVAASYIRLYNTVLAN